jgi:hypothetical protein
MGSVQNRISPEPGIDRAKEDPKPACAADHKADYALIRSVQNG